MRLGSGLYCGTVGGISIHAPRVGCDPAGSGLCAASPEFQSTHPVWGATAILALNKCQDRISIHAPRVGCDGAAQRFPDTLKIISIHAPRVGCDKKMIFYKEEKRYFNPRTPCGVRQGGSEPVDILNGFQSTHPVWGATDGQQDQRRPGHISIHAPRVGCDSKCSLVWSPLCNFNPRTPCGVRRYTPRCP